MATAFLTVVVSPSYLLKDLLKIAGSVNWLASMMSFN